MRSLPKVAVIGRQNVGKSTLFNRLVGRRVAIVDDTPGVTRDRLYAVVEWNGRAFGLVDTAGIISEITETFDEQIQLQVEVAINESDLLLFVVDAAAGPTAEEEDLVRSIWRTGKPVVLAVNKSDIKNRAPLADFHRWGFEHVIDVSAMLGTRTGDLLDILVALLPESPPAAVATSPGAISVAVVGKPNVGKSSLVNLLAGEQRVVVSEVAGTTRDPVDTVVRFHGRELVLIDTAGLRRKMKTAWGLDYYTLLRTVSCIERCDVAVMLLDASEGVQRQDMRIADIALENGKSLVLVMNKWDLVPDKETNTAVGIEKELKGRYPHLAHVPLIFISALTAQRVGRLLGLVLATADNRRVRLTGPELAEFLEQATSRLQPPTAGNRRIVINGIRQSGISPPTFEVFANLPDRVPEHYRRYLLNVLRDRFPFEGTPVRLDFTRRKEALPGKKRHGRGH
ncbi:MAG: ribosome biogenesis GTPase Der [Candidatus Glassbacteria bacterium]